MKAKYILSSLAGLSLLMAACTPDDHDLSQKDFAATDLVEGVAYTVTCDANNHITMQSLLDEKYQCFWIQPNGYSKGSTVEIDLPFAGTYPFVFGVDMQGGVIYGDTMWLTINTNNMSLLEDPLYTYLTGGVGSSKTWVPCDANYGVGQCTGPVMYCNPEDVLNDGSASTDIGINHMKPNWDPGYQSWLIPEDSPYMDSYMTFTLSDTEGCKLVEYRGESGNKGASTGVTLTGKYTLNLSDAAHPRLSFTDTYSMHNTGFDEVCANYTSNIYITELTPYFLQLATMRTNSEGPWWIIWNFIAKDVQDGTVEIPSDDAPVLEVATPVLPDMSAMTLDDIFTVSANGIEYIGKQVTYTVNEDLPYDWKWWDGQSAEWKDVVGDGGYNSTWAPTPGDDIYANELVLTKNSDGSVGYEYGSYNGSVTFDAKAGTLTFDNGITFFTVQGDMRTLELSGTVFNVLGLDPGAGIVIGAPASTDQKGNTDSYLVINLDTKPIGSDSGPITVPLDLSDITQYEWQENSCFRLGFHHYGEDGTGIFKDAASVKVPKGKSIKVTFSIKDASAWSAAPKCALIDNNIKTTWEPSCFDLDDAVTVNLNGTTTVALLNNTSKAQTFTATCLDLSIQLNGYYTAFADGECPDIVEIVSCVIE